MCSGRCDLGDKCRFSHEDTGPDTPKKKIQLCANFLKGSCRVQQCLIKNMDFLVFDKCVRVIFCIMSFFNPKYLCWNI